MSRNHARRQVKLGDRWVSTRGLPAQPWQDLYHSAMTVSWTGFILIIALVFVAINLFFALVFSLGAAPIANLSPGGFAGLFFFSVETLATVGYGDMHPQTMFAHLVATIEIFSGVVSTALITGLIFARFSRPRARIMFARHPVVTQMDGHRSLIIRAANARQNVIVDASAKLRLIVRETTREGESLRRIYDLPLVRDQHPIFLLGWNMVHRITAESPLAGMDATRLAAAMGSLILTINGVDETTGQTMQARETYAHDAIRWDHRYVDLFITEGSQEEVMDYTRFHDVDPDALKNT
jgi:inward rectifier potassium channel